MSAKLDAYFDEMLDMEVDLQDVYKKYGMGYYNIVLRLLPPDPKVGDIEDVIFQRERMAFLSAFSLDYISKKKLSIRTGKICKDMKLRLRDIEVEEFLKNAKDEEERLLVNGTDFSLRQLEIGNEVAAQVLGKELSPHWELVELAKEHEKIFRWAHVEAQNLVAHLFLVTAENIYKLARTSRSDLLAALDRAFGPETEEGLNDVALSYHLQNKVIGHKPIQ